MNRREFFKGLVAAGAVAAIPFTWVYQRIEELTIHDIITQAVRKHSKSMVDNIVQHNTLLKTLQRGKRG